MSPADSLIAMHQHTLNAAIQLAGWVFVGFLAWLVSSGEAVTETPRVIRVNPDGRMEVDPASIIGSESAKRHFREVADVKKIDGRTHYEGCEQSHHDCALVRLADARKRIEALRAALEYDNETRHQFLAAWANLTRDVAPLIAAFRDEPATVSTEQVDRALDAMADMQRIEARIGVSYFDRRNALAAKEEAP